MMPNWIPRPCRCRLKGTSYLACLGIAGTLAYASVAVQGTVPASPAPARKVAALVTVYRHNSHAELIAGRLLRTDTLDDKGNHSPLKLVSLYTDQRPTNDLGHGARLPHERLAQPRAQKGALVGGPVTRAGPLLDPFHAGETNRR